MFDKRLFSLVPGVKRLIAGKVICLWAGLMANIAFAFILVRLLSQLLVASDSKLFQCDIQASLICPANLYSLGYEEIAAPDIAQTLFSLALIMLVRFVVSRLGARFGTEAAERVKLALRGALYRKMLALGPSYARRVRTSDVIQSAGEGIEQIQSFFELFLPQLFYAVLAPITLFFVVAPLNMPAAVTLLVCAPLIVLIVGMVAMSASRVFKKYWGRYTDMGAAFLDDLQGLETLKTFDADTAAAGKMDENAERFRVMTMNVLQIQLRSLTAMDVVAYGGTALGIGVAVWQYFSGATLTVAGVLLIVLLSADFFIPLRQLGSFFHVAMNGMTSTKRIFTLLDAPEPQYGECRFAAGGRGVAVTFDHVGYSYDDSGSAAGDAAAGDAVKRKASRAALSDVNFAALPGMLTAIVGVSGSGKSTAAALLTGLMDDYSGSIGVRHAVAFDLGGPSTNGVASDAGRLVDDAVELRDLDAESLTGLVALVCARSHLFAGTLRDNLLMAMPNAGAANSGVPGNAVSDATLWDALRRARIDDFVREQSDGLDMRIESGAANLSGGQRQRIAIARALLSDRAIYVFDEATSSVDVDSEAKIMDAIRDLAREKTVIMITHRMANAVDADRIVVFDHGATVECGRHAVLIRANGTYAALFRAQQNIEQVGRRVRAGNPTNSESFAAAATSASLSGGAVESSADVETVQAAVDAMPMSHRARRETVRNTSRSNRGDVGGADSNANRSNASKSADSEFSWPLIARLLGMVGPLRPYMIIACTAGTVGHLAAAFLPFFGLAAVLAASGNPVWGLGVEQSLIAMAVCALIRGGLRYVEQYMNHNVAFRLLALFRAKAFAALRRLAPAKLVSKGKGDMIALITTDVELLEIFFAHTISPTVIALATTLVFAGVLAAINPWMAVLLIAAHVLVGILLPRLFALAVGGMGGSIRKESSELDDVMLDDMRGLDEIIRFAQGERRLADILARTRSLWSRRLKLSLRNGDFAGLGGVLVVAMTAAAALLAIVLALGNPYTTPQLLTAFVLIASSFGPTLALSALPASLTQTFASARRLFALMDEEPAVVESGARKPAYSGMALRDVTFAYDAAGDFAGGASSHGASSSGSAVLQNVSLDVPRAGILGIQGPSGRGKSTVLKLLMRYWDPQSGSVAMSGVPLPEVDASHRRRVQTMMSQETYLFDGTIRANLLLALPKSDVAGESSAGVTSADTAATDDLLWAALRKAAVADLVESLPQGLDTPVGELGGRLSEGERQRIGLARMFLRDADLVLFDEPTSRLDAFNESVVLRSINALAEEGNTAIVLVSHRDSTMRIADRTLRM